ncbi:MAG: hypothetical protein ACYC66_17045 [Chloroflexota bacterium]
MSFVFRVGLLATVAAIVLLWDPAVGGAGLTLADPEPTATPTSTSIPRSQVITKTGSPDVVPPGGVLNYTVTIRLGAAEDNVVIEDIMSNGVDLKPETTPILDGTTPVTIISVIRQVNRITYRFGLGSLSAGTHTLAYQGVVSPDANCHLPAKNEVHLILPGIPGGAAQFTAENNLICQTATPTAASTSTATAAATSTDTPTPTVTPTGTPTPTSTPTDTPTGAATPTATATAANTLTPTGTPQPDNGGNGADSGGSGDSGGGGDSGNPSNDNGSASPAVLGATPEPTPSAVPSPTPEPMAPVSSPTSSSEESNEAALAVAAATPAAASQPPTLPNAGEAQGWGYEGWAMIGLLLLSAGLLLHRSGVSPSR